jgi:hypothetical protein
VQRQREKERMSRRPRNDDVLEQQQSTEDTIRSSIFSEENVIALQPEVLRTLQEPPEIDTQRQPNSNTTITKS